MLPNQGMEPCQKHLQAQRKTKLHFTRQRKKSTPGCVNTTICCTNLSYAASDENFQKQMQQWIKNKRSSKSCRLGKMTKLRKSTRSGCRAARPGGCRNAGPGATAEQSSGTPHENEVEDTFGGAAPFGISARPVIGETCARFWSWRRTKLLADTSRKHCAHSGH